MLESKNVKTSKTDKMKGESNNFHLVLLLPVSCRFYGHINMERGPKISFQKSWLEKNVRKRRLLDQKVEFLSSTIRSMLSKNKNQKVPSSMHGSNPDQSIEFGLIKIDSFLHDWLNKSLKKIEILFPTKCAQPKASSSEIYLPTISTDQW